MKVARVRELEKFLRQPRIHDETWDLVTHSPHKKAIGCRWIYKVQYNVDCSINHYKARLVAKGYIQTDGVNYKETFALVAKMTIVQTIIALIVAKGCHHHQMDMKNAFLQGELEEEVLMIQPPGFESTNHQTAVCQLKKPLYELKQALCAWHSKITEYLHQIGFQMLKTYNSLYVIVLYLDDLVIWGENLTDIKMVKSLLSNRFEMKDMKKLDYFLNIEIIRTPIGIMIFQQHYILNLLYKSRMIECKPVLTPLYQYLKLYADSWIKESKLTQYR